MNVFLPYASPTSLYSPPLTSGQVKYGETIPHNSSDRSSGVFGHRYVWSYRRLAKSLENLAVSWDMRRLAITF